MSEPTTCYLHPKRETALRCKRCERPICASCAEQTPTGYICPNCAEAHEKKFNTASAVDYVFVFLVAAFLSFWGAVATVFISSLFWGIFVFGLAPIFGAIIGDGVRRLVKGRRSRALNYTLVAGIAIGAAPVLVFTALPFFALLFMGGAFHSEAFGAFYALFPVIWQLVYLAIAIPSAYHQFSGLVFRR